jgi:drug/metabolite transporter (DMT)-like permease
VYFAALGIRYRTGAVTKEQLSAAPWKLLAGIGLIEALSQILGFIGASKLPGVVLPLLQQSVMFWNLGFSSIILRKKLAWQQIVGATAVVAGVCIAALPEDGGTGILSGVPIKYIGIFVISMAFPALDNITKEKVFKETKEKLNGEQLDIFVVNSFASAFQALSVTLMLPGIAGLRGINFFDLPAYLVEGTKVFLGANGNGAPLLPILYVTANLAFNICSLLVVRTSGALVNSLAIAALTPLTLWAFSFSLPYLGNAPQLGPQFLTGSAILIAGLLTYNSTSLVPQIKEKLGKSKSD